MGLATAAAAAGDQLEGRTMGSGEENCVCDSTWPWGCVIVADIEVWSMLLWLVLRYGQCYCGWYRVMDTVLL